MRKKLLTDSVLAQIPRWINEGGLRPAEIAEKIGCTLGTLRVWCSLHSISMRQPSRSREAPDADLANLVLSFPEQTRAGLGQRAELLGLSPEALVKVLIETIDKDNLYAAVLDSLGSRDNRAGRQTPT